jgi:hypothetical protein
MHMHDKSKNACAHQLPVYAYTLIIRCPFAERDICIYMDLGLTQSEDL